MVLNSKMIVLQIQRLSLTTDRHLYICSPCFQLIHLLRGTTLLILCIDENVCTCITDYYYISFKIFTKFDFVAVDFIFSDEQWRNVPINPQGGLFWNQHRKIYIEIKLL